MPRRLCRVLSIDGGGVRAVLAARILAEIEDRTAQPITSCFDVIVATGSGGLLAALLTLPAEDGRRPKYSAREVLALFKANARLIFPTGDWSTWLRTLDPFFPGGRFSNEGLVTFCEKAFGDAEMGRLLIPVTLLACDISSRSPVLLRSAGVTKDLRVRDCAIAVASTPGFFPPWQVGGVSCVDGIVVASNPSLMAHWEARSMFPSVKDMLLISLGSGAVERAVAHEEAASWSAAEWLSPLLSACVESSGAAVHVLMQQLAAEPPKSRSSSPSFLPGSGAVRRSGILYRRYQPRIALPAGRAGATEESDGPTLDFLEISAEQFIRENEESFVALAQLVGPPHPSHSRSASERTMRRAEGGNSGMYSSGTLSVISAGGLSRGPSALSPRPPAPSPFDPSAPFFAPGPHGYGHHPQAHPPAPFVVPPPSGKVVPYGPTAYHAGGVPREEPSALMKVLSCGGVCRCDPSKPPPTHARQPMFSETYSHSF